MQQGWSHEVSVVGQERCGAGAAELSDRGVSAPIAISRSYKDDETSPMNLQGVSGTNQAGLEAGAGMATRVSTRVPICGVYSVYSVFERTVS